MHFFKVCDMKHIALLTGLPLESRKHSSMSMNPEVMLEEALLTCTDEKSSHSVLSTNIPHIPSAV